jgi:hypothetical protein
MHMTIQTAGLVDWSQKLISTAAALSSAGSTITQLNLFFLVKEAARVKTAGNLHVVPSHSKTEGRVHETFRQFDVSTRYREICNHLAKGYHNS